MSDITLSAGVRSNLLSLQNTADMMGRTQNRLATGKKVNSALDNPTNFFTASSLQTRSNDLSSLLDSMSNGIKTLEAADNGLTAMTKTLETMQATLRQARQDKTFQTSSFEMGLDDNLVGTETLSLSGGALSAAQEIDLTNNTAAVLEGLAFTDIDLSNNADNEFAFDINGDTITLTDADGTAGVIDIDEAVTAIQDQMDALNGGAGNGITVSKNEAGDALVFTTTATGTTASVEIDNIATTGTGVVATAADLGFTNGDEATGDAEAKTVDALVSEINNNTDLNTAIRASNDNGKLRIENLSTQTLDVDGATSSGIIDGTTTGASTVEGNSVRAGLSRQFNELRDQLDKLADDASYNGINLLRGDNLRLTFNETGTSTIDIQVAGGQSVNSAYLNVFNVDPSDFDSDSGIDGMLGDITSALNTIRSQASEFGSNLSVVENRTQFTKNMMNTLQTGADNLVLADTNEEGANMLALQTRQQLSSVALSLASQADQAVLRLF